MAAGGSAVLAPQGTVTGAELLVAVEAEDRRDQKAPLVRLASAVEPEWLLDLFPERLREIAEVEWNRAASAWRACSALMFDGIAIETSRGAADPEAAGALLARKAVEAGLARFADAEEVGAFRARVDFAAQHGAVAPLDDAVVEAALRTLAPACGASPNSPRPRVTADCCARSSRDSGRGAAPGGGGRAARLRLPRGRDVGTLRGRPAAVDRVAFAGFLRHARDAARWRAARCRWWCGCWRRISGRCR